LHRDVEPILSKARKKAMAALQFGLKAWTTLALKPDIKGLTKNFCWNFSNALQPYG
jgi:hypothetical protein